MLQLVCIGIPQLERAILRSTHYDGELRMEASKCHVACMTGQCSDLCFCGIIPYPRRGVVGACDDVRFVLVRVVVNVIDAFAGMGLNGLVRGGGGEVPKFDSSIKGGRCKYVWVFWVGCDGHDIVAMSFEGA